MSNLGIEHLRGGVGGEPEQLRGVDRAVSDALERIHPERTFKSYADAEQLECTLKDLQANGLVEDIPIEAPKHPMLKERWYVDKSSGQVYRYCPPEFLARGIRERVR